MKSQKHLFDFRWLILPAFLSFYLLNPSLSMAQSVPAAVVESKPLLSVNYVGGVGDYLFFEVVMQQPDETRAVLKIRDGEGTELYNESFFKRTLVKKIKVLKNEVPKLDFIYTTSKGELAKSYLIKVDFKETIEVTEVTKL